MKRKYVLLISLLLILAACQEKTEGISKEEPFVGGTRGITINFAENQPPEEVYDKGQFPFDVNLKLENVGGYDVAAKDITVKLTGLDPQEFGKTEADFTMHPEDDLRGTKKSGEGNIFPGAVTYVLFENLNYKNQLDANFNPPLKADVCYRYGTIALSQICVQEDVIKVEEDAVCQTKGKKGVQNSGAPLQVTSFEQIPVGNNKIGFTFNIEHKGQGKYYLPNTGCDSSYQKKNKIFVTVKTDLPGLSCSGLAGGDANSGELILSESGTSVMCIQEVSSSVDYQKRVRITLDYDYKESNSMLLLVKSSGTLGG